MFKHLVAPMLALLLIACAQSAHAYIDPPYLTPGAPVAGETVSVNIGYGVCDVVQNELETTRVGNAIRVVFFGVRYTDPFTCNLPSGVFVYPVGAYPPGSYTLQVDLVYPGPGGENATETLAVLPFTVSAAPVPAVPAPANNLLALGVLMVLLLASVAWRFRARCVPWLVLVIIGVPLGVRAQDAPDNPAIELLLTNAPGAPTPAQLVSYFHRTPRSGTLPLPSLSVSTPSDVQYLLSVRAEGDFLAWLQANPASPRAQLENYVIVLYPPGTDTTQALAALRADPYVAAAYVPTPIALSSVSLRDFEVDGPATEQDSGQYGRADLNIDAAWQITGGWALVAAIDMGLYQKHPALRQFSDTGCYLNAGCFLGGNFIPVASLDVGRAGLLPPNNGPYYDSVDEAKPLDYADTTCPNPVPVQIGHGTHTAGLLAANGLSGQGVQGTCKHCGLAEWKISYTACDHSLDEVYLTLNSNATPVAITNAVDTGAQVLSMSFGGPHPVCDPASLPPLCLAIQYAADHDTAMVGASGNNRSELQYPASDNRYVIAAGGFNDTLALWDESPGSSADCPFIGPPYHSTNECGSNYTQSTQVISYDHQELMASAKHVLSTTYPNFDYQAYAECGDSFGTPMGDGIGWCTGTSMSAPQIAGVVGLLRSINPLTPVGTPYGAAGTVRKVLATTTYEAQAGHGWEKHFGYGRPDAAAAARTMLGGTTRTRNRLTPLFRLYSSGTLDYADVTSPQYALALMINQKKAWLPDAASPTVSSYPYFPHAVGETPPSSHTPRASAYVMTTEVAPRNDGPALLPLYLMDKEYASGRDFMLVTTPAEIEVAYFGSDGIHCDRATPNCAIAAYDYTLRNIQGYIYAPCTHEPGCIPAGAVKLWREYNTTNEDCAVFLNSEKAAFEGAGYTGYCPVGNTTKMLGYVYSSQTPCGAGIQTLPCASDSIFKNGFEML